MPALRQAEIIAAQEQLEALQQAARAFLKKEWNLKAVRGLIGDQRGFDDGLWAQIGGLGWPALLAPEDMGGIDGTLAELCVLAEELGRALAPSPLISTLIGCVALLGAGNRSAIAPLLADVADGKAILGLAVYEPDAKSEWTRPSVSVRVSGDGFVLSGIKTFVPHAKEARALITTAAVEGSGELLLLAVPATSSGVVSERLRVMDWSAMDAVEFHDVEIGADAVLARGKAAENLIARTRVAHDLAISAELVGTAAAALDMAIDYAQSRVAFGRPIGVFQAVKHPIANAFCDVEVARSLVHGAAQEIAQDIDDPQSKASLATFWCANRMRAVPELCVQMFGGIAITWEHDIHFFLRHATTLTARLGPPKFHRKVIIDSMRAG